MAFDVGHSVASAVEAPLHPQVFRQKGIRVENFGDLGLILRVIGFFDAKVTKLDRPDEDDQC